jgi:hypothetical protein
MGLAVVRFNLDGEVGKRKGHFNIVCLQRKISGQESTLGAGILTSIGLRKFSRALIGPALRTKLDWVAVICGMSIKNHLH